MLDAKIAPVTPARSVAAEARTIPDLLLRRVAQTPSGLAWKQKIGGAWRPTSWQSFFDRAAALATFLMEGGVAPGDKLTIVGSTRGEWCVSDLGGLLAGAVTVGAYATLTAEQLAYIVDHSDSKLAIVEDKEQLDKILATRALCPKLERVLVWREEDATGGPPGFVVPLSRALETKFDRKRIEERVDALDPMATAIIVYTSGTTGPPKGAMISHHNVLTVLRAETVMAFDADDCGLSFLPMAHVAERVLSFYGRLVWGTATAYASSVPAVLEEVKEVRPTLFGSVPRIFEKAYAKVQGEVGKASPAKQRVFRWAERTGLEVVRAWQAGQEPGLALKLQYKLADRLVFSKLREVFGGRVKFFITGAAPIPRRVLEFFWAAGFPIYEVYGMTEATVLTHGNKPGAVRLGSVGKVTDYLEERLAEDGEILVRGPTVFQGYYKDPAATAEAIDADGWLHTGDIGTRDADGYLTISDRKKHLIITAGGKNLTPANIENEIKTQDPLLSQVHAHGDTRPYVTALITLSPLDALDIALAESVVSAGPELDAMRQALLNNPLAAPPGLSAVLAKVAELPSVRARVKAAVERGNKKLSRVEQVKRVMLLDRELSLELDEVTPTLKVKRRNLEKKFAERFDALYADARHGLVIQEGGAEA